MGKEALMAITQNKRQTSCCKFSCQENCHNTCVSGKEAYESVYMQVLKEAPDRNSVDKDGCSMELGLCLEGCSALREVW